MQKLWQHTDGREILVLADRKIRRHYTGRFIGKQWHAGHMQPPTGSDEWPILYRSEVPALTDEQWYDSPGEGWTEVEPNTDTPA